MLAICPARPGDRLLVDGEVVASQGLEIDESLLTGEDRTRPQTAGRPGAVGQLRGRAARDASPPRVGEGQPTPPSSTEQARRLLPRHSELRDGVTKSQYIPGWSSRSARYCSTRRLRNDEDFGSAITGAVAGIVTMIPRGPGADDEHRLAVGVVRLGQRNALVQELPAIEGLARVDVLCSTRRAT
ncbi:hypothetical protein [Nonomuraea dietziae]|uniref:hypothetical protein n=1 Tax=Nonomuraea dietziae TaxID=65515 RepID=UPI0031E20661